MTNPQQFGTKSQWEFINDVTTKYIAFIGGMGSGKTYAGALKAINLAHANPGCAGMLVAPTYVMIEDITKRTLFDLLERLCIPFAYKAQRNKIIFANDAEIWFRSADKPDKLKGSNLAWVGLDEAGSMARMVWDIAVSRIRDPKARILQLFVTGTPEGFNWLYTLFGDGKIKPRYRKILASTRENIFVPDEYIKNLEQNFDENLQKAYIDGEFINTRSGRVFYGYRQDRHLIREKYKINYNIPLIVSCDFNRNPCIWEMFQDDGQFIHCFDELAVRDANTFLMCDKMAEIDLNKYNGLHFYGDYTSLKQRSTAAALSDWQIIKEFFSNYYCFELFLKNNPKVKDSVECTNNLFNKNKIKVYENCPFLIDDLAMVGWADNGAELDKRDSDRTHASDDLRYYCSYRYAFKTNSSGLR